MIPEPSVPKKRAATIPQEIQTDNSQSVSMVGPSDRACAVTECSETEESRYAGSDREILRLRLRMSRPGSLPSDSSTQSDPGLRYRMRCAVPRVRTDGALNRRPPAVPGDRMPGDRMPGERVPEHGGDVPWKHRHTIHPARGYRGSGTPAGAEQPFLRVDCTGFRRIFSLPIPAIDARCTRGPNVRALRGSRSGIPSAQWYGIRIVDGNGSISSRCTHLAIRRHPPDAP